MKKNILISIALMCFCHINITAQTSAALYFKKISLAELQNYPLSPQRIDGKLSALQEGSILAYETNEHRKGKLLIRRSDYNLEIDWVTYRNDGQVYRSGQNTIVHGTYQFDLDDASSKPEGYDFWWEQVDNQQRYLVPKNGAKFNDFRQTSFDCQITLLGGPKTVQPGKTWQEPLRVAVRTTMRIQAKVYIDVVLSTQPSYVEPARSAPSYAAYQSGGLVPGGRFEVNFEQENTQTLNLDGILWPDVPPGKYYLLVIIDASDQLHEVNERNNVVVHKVEVPGAFGINDGNIYPYPLKKVKLSNNTEIAYADQGSGDYTLVFVHGLNGYHQAWKKNIDELRKNYRCIALDLPGNGQSSIGDYPFSIHFYADIVEEFILTLRLKNVVLIGHSLGGQVAVLTAQKYLLELKKLILMAPSGLKQYSSQERAGVDWLAQPKRVKARTDSQLKMSFDVTYATGKTPPDASFMLEYRLNLRNRPDYFDYFCKMTHQLSLAIVDEPVLEQLATIKIPTLVLWGKEDRQLSPNLAQEIQQRIFSCEVQIVSPCGHMLPWECAEKVNSMLINFIQR
jgi:pimeloyl-ACP methyl ester carboxylesterase